MKQEPQASPEVASPPTPPALPVVTPPSSSPASSSLAPILEAKPELDPGEISEATVPSPAVQPPEAGTASSAPQHPRFALALSLIVLVFAILGGLVFASYNTGQAELEPARVAQAYCRDLESQQFSAAYALLSSSYRVNLTLSQFIQVSQLQDAVDGNVRACPTAVSPGLDFSFGLPQDHVAFLITIARSKPFTGHVELIRQQGGWKVEAIEQSLEGTDVGPLVVANTFCSSVIQGDYAAAYQTLSSRQQSLASETVFAQQFKSSFGALVRLRSCALDYASYHVQAGSAAVSMTFNLTISTPATGALATGLVTVLDFTQEQGGWKLDDFTLLPPAQ
ncbi:MAG: hypothetical protein ACLQUY_25420 [Ktedonobacterales bacterium]